MRKRKPGREGVPPGLLWTSIWAMHWSLQRVGIATVGELMAARKVPASCEKLGERHDHSIISSDERKRTQLSQSDVADI